MTSFPSAAHTDDHAPSHRANGAEIGSLIGGVAGLVFLIVNSAAFSPLGRILVLLMGLAAFAGVVALAVRGLRRSQRERRDSAAPSREGAAGAEDASGQSPFTRSYWIIVGVEVLALFGGTQLLTGLGAPELGVAWVAIVVGTHFFALGYVFRLRRFHVLASLVTACGIAGFIAFFVSAHAFVPVLAGVLPGFVLLALSLWALAPATPATPATAASAGPSSAA